MGQHTAAAIWLNFGSDSSLQNQLARQVKALIQDGGLRPGELMPSSRDLAQRLQVSRNTIVYAYERLVGEGYLETRERSGVFVSPSIAAVLPSAREQPKRRAAGESKRVSSASTRQEKLTLPSPFRPCQPDVTLFPLAIWNRLRGRALRNQGAQLLHYQSNCSLGLPALRKVLASYLRDHRGVKCDWRQVAITTGSQQGLFLLSELLLRKGDLVYMEDPGYPGAQLAWKHAGATVVRGSLDEEGMKLPEVTGRRFSLLYTTPSRQFPTGVCLSLARRLALLEYAAETRTWIVEDDYDSEFRYSAPPLPSLQSLDRFGRVIYLGTFSKVLFPSLRLGYVVLPEELVEDFMRLRALMDDHGPLIDQATLAMFLESGAFSSHIRRCRKAYAERQSTFLTHVKVSGLPFVFRYTDGGMNLTCLLPETSSDKAWSAKCREAALDVPPLSRYSLFETQPGLVFGFTAFTPNVIRSALDKLKQSLKSL